MNVPFFTPKAAASTLVGVGSMGGGGGAVYLYQMPKNWKDLLIKEGYVFLNTEQDYKGMFNDQKENNNWKNENDLKEAQDSDVKNKTQQYCEKQFNTTLPSSSSEDYSSTKQKLIAFCTTEGIQTVKARLIQSKKTSDTQTWIGESDADDKWKTVFAVYRYNNDFISWLKEDSGEASLDSSSKINDHHAKLKTACTKLLKKNHREITNNKLFDYGSWWCVELGYSTIKEKIKKSDSSWEEKQENESGWDTLKTTWAQTESVKKWAQKAKGSSPDDVNSELDETGLKALCKSDYINAKIADDDDNYKEKYQVIKAVCKKESSKE